MTAIKLTPHEKTIKIHGNIGRSPEPKVKKAMSDGMKKKWAKLNWLDDLFSDFTLEELQNPLCEVYINWHEGNRKIKVSTGLFDVDDMCEGAKK